MNRTVFLTLWGVGGLALAGTAAVAGSGVGGVFNLGQVNTVNAQTQLRGTTASPVLTVLNANPNGFAGFFRNTGATNNPRIGRGIRVLGARAQGNEFPSVNYAGAGEFAGPNGVVGYSTFAQGAGVAGFTGTRGNIGVYGVSTKQDGYAGFFQNFASSGPGIRALSGGATGNEMPAGWAAGAGEFIGGSGVIGVSTAVNAAGVLAAKKAGVLGYALVVIGKSDLAGDVDITGTLDAGTAHFTTVTKSSGSFKIDHPLDPENKYLYHSFVESPDMMNIYNGNVITDAEGEAVVELPDYFDALNRDPRYQLTVIGSPATVYVFEEISDGAFSIKTSEPNVKVSWQVTGIRQDAFAKQHPIVVEEEKAVADRGHYLHPDAFGKPASLAIRRAVPQLASAAD